MKTTLSVVLCAADVRRCEHFWLAGNRVEPSSISPLVWRPSPSPGCDCDAAMGFSNWAAGQPNNAGQWTTVHEACLAMSNRTSSAWYDMDCTVRTCAICQYDDNDDVTNTNSTSH